MSEQVEIERDEEIEQALLEAEEEAQSDPTRLDHRTVMDQAHRAIVKER
ncbi:hypothetical protein [Cohnella silvisoli]|uniref:YfhD family protein n=1 Tax=Cohnella silvisoli TaxID=2873699 RepID=A0ABV1KVF5_9BACL|nr:hypothetical protein [Cohnella silvisoli]MCD9023488.1 hypothetical protein [Cohnella silvisoli]